VLYSLPALRKPAGYGRSQRGRPGGGCRCRAGANAGGRDPDRAGYRPGGNG